jgi:hypothetical protein
MAAMRGDHVFAAHPAAAGYHCQQQQQQQLLPFRSQWY